MINRSISDNDIKSLFLKKQVIKIIYLIKDEEVRHLQKASKETNNIHIKSCIDYNLKKLANNPDMIIIITAPNIIKRNKGVDALLVSKNLIEEYNINQLPITSIIDTFKYNLFELPDFKI